MEINKIYNEDCIEGKKKIPSASIDMVLTDPPYTSPTVHAFGRQKVNRLSDLAIQEFYFAISSTYSDIRVSAIIP